MENGKNHVFFDRSDEVENDQIKKNSTANKQVTDISYT
jgi:hypothetical protein